MVAQIERTLTLKGVDLPWPLRDLERISWNYWWSWSAQGVSIFRDLDPTLWEECENTSRLLLSEVSEFRLAEMATDPFYIERVAKLARQAGVERLVHISGIGSDARSTSPYIRSRGEGEAAVLDAFPSATLIRPAVMFGLGDAFVTPLLVMIQQIPAFPMFGAGTTKLQPVYVEDVAEANQADSCHGCSETADGHTRHRALLRNFPVPSRRDCRETRSSARRR